MCTIAVIVSGGCAARQPARAFLDLQERVRSGNTVYVTDYAGMEMKGKIVDLSASALVLDVNGTHRRLDQGTVQSVQRRGDSLWNGMLIGVAVGASAMLLADPRYEPCANDAQKLCANAQMAQRVLAIGIMGATGAAIDALISRRHYVYLAPGPPPPEVREPDMSVPTARSAAIIAVAPGPQKRATTICKGAISIAQWVSCVHARSTVSRPTGDIR